MSRVRIYFNPHSKLWCATRNPRPARCTFFAQSKFLPPLMNKIIADERRRAEKQAAFNAPMPFLDKVSKEISADTERLLKARRETMRVRGAT